MSLTRNDAFEAELRKALQNGREITYQELENALSFEAYQQRVGYLRAIKFMEEACTDIHDELEKR